MQQYKELVGRVMAQGTKKTSRTGIDTVSAFGESVSFDLTDGRIPLLTTKKVATGGVVKELLWMLSGDTNTRVLNDRRVKIWNAWALKPEDIPEGSPYSVGDLGPIYSAAWRRVPITNGGMETIDCPEGLLDGPVILPERCHTWQPVTDLLYEDVDAKIRILGEANDLAVIQHMESNYIQVVPQADSYVGIVDPYAVDSETGLVIGVVPYDNTHVRDLWDQMHETKAPVSARWKCYENFYTDIKRIPGYELWCQDPERYGLCDAYYGSRGFDVDRVVFLDENRGDQIVINGDTVTRPRLYQDQIADAIARLKSHPDCRRNIVTAWHLDFCADDAYSPQENVLCNRAALSSCHAFFQFYTRELTPAEKLNVQDDSAGKRRLSCQLYIRSNDLPLGHPFNIVQYALLTHMIAQCTDMVAERLTVVIGDAHIYDNQVDILMDQLQRPLKEPTARVALNPAIKDIDSFDVPDIKILDYDHHPMVIYPAAAV